MHTDSGSGLEITEEQSGTRLPGCAQEQGGGQCFGGIKSIQACKPGLKTTLKSIDACTLALTKMKGSLCTWVAMHMALALEGPESTRACSVLEETGDQLDMQLRP